MTAPGCWPRSVTTCAAITRMRLRAEVHRGRCPSQTARLADLDQMRSMLESVLSFLRNDRKLKNHDAESTSQAHAARHQPIRDMGHNVTYAVPIMPWSRRVPTTCIAASPTSWRNAVRFGSEPRSASRYRRQRDHSM